MSKADKKEVKNRTKTNQEPGGSDGLCTGENSRNSRNEVTKNLTNKPDTVSGTKPEDKNTQAVDRKINATKKKINNSPLAGKNIDCLESEDFDFSDIGGDINLDESMAEFEKRLAAELNKSDDSLATADLMQLLGSSKLDSETEDRNGPHPMQSDDTEHAENITGKIRDEDKLKPECQINGPENMSMELEQSGLKRPNMDSDTQVDVPAAVKKSKTNDVIVDTEPLRSPNENHSMDINEERRENHKDMEIYVFVKGDRVDITNVSTSRVFADICDLINRKPVITRSNRSLRILCRNNAEKEILMGTNYIAGHRVIFSEPYAKSRNALYTLNRGIIFGVDEELTEEQISYEIDLPAKRIVRKIGGEIKITRQVILYFEGKIPAHVFFLWRRYEVSVYIPEPTNCYNCQKFGHKANKCNSSSKCPICSGHHSYEDCDVRKTNNKDERRALCPNCKGQHSASYKGCRIYQEAKIIKKIQISEA